MFGTIKSHYLKASPREKLLLLAMGFSFTILLLSWVFPPQAVEWAVEMLFSLLLITSATVQVVASKVPGLLPSWIDKKLDTLVEHVFHSDDKEKDCERSEQSGKTTGG